MTVLPGPAGGSIVEWSSTFKAAPGTDEATARAAIEGIYEAVLNNRQCLPIPQQDVRTYIESLVAEPIEPDKRFVYYLLGATGICVIPLTSFFTDIPGFRMTLLDRDEEKFEQVVRTLAEKIVAYVESSR
jgi:aspartate/methionine/tyrosine aminotransferase